MTDLRALLNDAAKSELFKVESIHHIHADQCLCGFTSSVSRDRTKHIMEVTLAAALGSDTTNQEGTQ